MTKQAPNNNNQLPNKKFDLEDRTLEFSKKVIIFCKKLPKNTINFKLIDQLIRSATSIGANYCEADDAESKRDFKHKIGICKKEARESKHFLRMLLKAIPEIKERVNPLLKEAKELNLIFNSIYRKV